MSKSRFSAAAPIVFLAALVQAAAPVVSAQPLPIETQGASLVGAGGGSTVRVDLASSGASQDLSLPRGKSAIVELPVDVRDVLITNPAVADAVLRTPRRIYVLGLASGQTDAILFDASGRRILSLNIRVDADGGALAATINRVIPGARVKVESIGDSVILTGMVQNPIDAERAGQIAARYVAKPEQVLNMLSVAGKDQVMLKVRIVEVQRSVIKQLGVNLNAVLQQGSGSITLGQAANFSINGTLPGGASIGGTYAEGGDSLTGSIRAFERVGLVRTLAEPNLTAVSGEAARFLAGGEYPVPVNQDNSSGSVTVEYKPFGVGLAFTPVVMSGGRISLKISTEISELTTQGAFTLGGGSSNTSLTIPALTVRRAETSVELPSGGSMMIAGLIQQQTRENLDALPGVGGLPVLGSLFRSRDYLSGDTEMVVLVTAYLVDPNNPNAFQTPADGLRFANDAETILMGKLNKSVQAPPGANAGRTWQGPIGYVIE
ncbi:MAG TPA: type II and III secretion system protein family protein [Caulobacter sp.]|nr:type II and III secretion system protein family protein [Caulobacter sp.]